MKNTKKNKIERPLTDREFKEIMMNLAERQRSMEHSENIKAGLRAKKERGERIK